jgi:hypothetical protein
MREQLETCCERRESRERSEYQGPAASCVQEAMAEQRFPFRQIRRRRRQPSEHRRERSEQRAAVYTNERAARLRYSRQSALQLAASE